MRTLRMYLGELDDDFVEVVVTDEVFAALRFAGRVAVDDGGVWFVELVLDYRGRHDEA